MQRVHFFFESSLTFLFVIEPHPSGSPCSDSYIVRVKAVVMTRDESSGGWLAQEGGGLSRVGVCKVVPADLELLGRNGFLIFGERLKDKQVRELMCARLHCMVQKSDSSSLISSSFSVLSRWSCSAFWRKIWSTLKPRPLSITGEWTTGSVACRFRAQPMPERLIAVWGRQSRTSRRVSGSEREMRKALCSLFNM